MLKSAMTLSQLCEIRSGYQFRHGLQARKPSSSLEWGQAGTAEQEGFWVRVVQIKDVEDFVFSQQDLETARIRKVRPYQIQQNDVLFLARSHHFGAVLIDAPLQEVTVATHFFIILRVLPSSLISPAFLAWSLNRPRTLSELGSRARKTHMPVVSRRDLGSLEIQVPPLETQHQIVALDELRKQEVQVIAQLLQNHALLVEAAAEQAIQQHQSTSSEVEEEGLSREE